MNRKLELADAEENEASRMAQVSALLEETRSVQPNLEAVRERGGQFVECAEQMARALNALLELPSTASGSADAAARSSSETDEPESGAESDASAFGGASSSAARAPPPDPLIDSLSSAPAQTVARQLAQMQRAYEELMATLVDRIRASTSRNPPAVALSTAAAAAPVQYNMPALQPSRVSLTSAPTPPPSQSPLFTGVPMPLPSRALFTSAPTPSQPSVVSTAAASSQSFVLTAATPVPAAVNAQELELTSRSGKRPSASLSRTPPPAAASLEDASSSLTAMVPPPKMPKDEALGAGATSADAEGAELQELLDTTAQALVEDNVSRRRQMPTGDLAIRVPDDAAEAVQQYEVLRQSKMLKFAVGECGFWSGGAF